MVTLRFRNHFKRVSVDRYRKWNGNMNETKANRNGRLSELIRREIGSETNRRFLARMPAFRPVAELPENLRTLLEELDCAETKAPARAHSPNGRR